MNPVARVILLAALWFAWWLPFLLFFPKNRGKAVRKDPRARWGIILNAIAYFLMYLHSPNSWNTPIPAWRAVFGCGFALVACLLSWTAILHLGRQWRIDAGLNADHELIRSGPYRVVRHPIYASMFCTLLMSAALVGTLPGWPISIALFVVGTEIRVRVEDGLLRERFGEQFTGWQRQVPAYVPFIR